MNTERTEHRTRGVWPDWLMMAAVAGGLFAAGLVGHIDGRRQLAEERATARELRDEGRAAEREDLQQAIDRGWHLTRPDGSEVQDVTR